MPTYESMVFKKAGDGEKIPWHQDAVHTHKHRVFNFDHYLDESKIGGGALRVVPKSQWAIQDACAVSEQYDWDLPGVIQVGMEPGDVLLHGSERTLGSKLPPQLAVLNRTNINVQKLAVEAAITGNVEHVYRAIALDPLTGALLTLEQIKAMTTELLEAQAAWLPQFELPKQAVPAVAD